MPANSASLIIGLAWGLTLPLTNLWQLAIPLILAYSVITLVGLFAAHINTMSDYELDQKDETKRKLVQAMGLFGKDRLKKVMAIELSASLVILLTLTFFQGKIAFPLMWLVAVFFAYAYSAEPLRFKSRSLVAVFTLLIVLSILPVTFVTYAFTYNLDLAFFLFLAGQALTVYGVIIPAEIRDYFGDKATGIITMTVRLGLVKASILDLSLLSIGGLLCTGGFVLKLASGSLPFLSGFLVVMGVVYLYVLSKYWKILNLSRTLQSGNHTCIEQEIVRLATENPKWITMVTQSIVFMCLVLLVAKVI